MNKTKFQKGDKVRVISQGAAPDFYLIVGTIVNFIPKKNQYHVTFDIGEALVNDDDIEILPNE